MKLFFSLSLKIYAILTLYILLTFFFGGNVLFILKYQEFFIMGFFNPVILKIIFFTGIIPSIVLGYIGYKKANKLF
ncbi:hypothetical protein OQ257_01920 [Actinobacillus equuli subsp. equuli]|uniref:Uncharacterized protein n=1 Tax=Actinobacillus equuli subsp. equuli TaxID=202947 RepID=A0A9X4JCQ5_ACTEU|nr:hypothetical protein [Actinobacillus equuli]MDE8033929.1 hypothetical protein [Actinobacillus equuli subsp. equuli]MDG4948029.1 hypothetical protein [Actinobacillus equuli subsp. haemolyticus]